MKNVFDIQRSTRLSINIWEFEQGTKDARAPFAAHVDVDWHFGFWIKSTDSWDDIENQLMGCTNHPTSVELADFKRVWSGLVTKYSIVPKPRIDMAQKADVLMEQGYWGKIIHGWDKVYHWFPSSSKTSKCLCGRYTASRQDMLIRVWFAQVNPCRACEKKLKT